MATNNSINFAQLSTKSAPTTSDIVLLSDVAASGANKQATIGSLPIVGGQITIENKTNGLFATLGIPGMFSATTSNSITQSKTTLLNTSVVFVPFYLSQSWAVTAMRFTVVAGNVTGTATCGIYASSTSGTYNNFPTGSTVCVGQATTNINNTYVSCSLSAATLSANTLYWAAFQTSTPGLLSILMGQLNIDHSNIISQVAASSSWTANILTYTNSYSAGTLPTLTQSSIAITASNYLPTMVLQ